MKEAKYHLYLDDNEYNRVIQSLICLKNSLIEQGRYTDAVDDVLIKLSKARKKACYSSLHLIESQAACFSFWEAGGFLHFREKIGNQKIFEIFSENRLSFRLPIPNK